jgi:uncharacterized OB-fold protein
MHEMDSNKNWALPGTLAHDDAGYVRLRCGLCNGCGWMAFPQPKICANCWSEDIQTTLLSRTGQLYSYSTVHRGREGWDTPYTIGVVDFEDGKIRISGLINVAVGADIALDSTVTVSVGRLRGDKSGNDWYAHRFDLLEVAS